MDICSFLSIFHNISLHLVLYSVSCCFLVTKKRHFKKFAYHSDSDSNEDDAGPQRYKPVPVSASELESRAAQRRRPNADGSASTTQTTKTTTTTTSAIATKQRNNDNDNDDGDDASSVADATQPHVNYFAAALTSALEAPLPRPPPHVATLTVDATGDVEAGEILDPILVGTRTAQQRTAQRLSKRQSLATDGSQRAQRMNRFHKKTPSLGDGEKRLVKMACEGGCAKRFINLILYSNN